MLSSQARKAGDPVVSTIYIKGNRMAKVNPDSIEIIDLDKETITSIDNLKHTYTVMTLRADPRADGQGRPGGAEAERPAACSAAAAAESRRQDELSTSKSTTPARRSR